jgi:hypothetical protein
VLSSTLQELTYRQALVLDAMHFLENEAWSKSVAQSAYQDMDILEKVKDITEEQIHFSVEGINAILGLLKKKGFLHASRYPELSFYQWELSPKGRTVFAVHT